MPLLNRVEIFLEVARQQSFSKAAGLLGVTGPAASKQVKALEDELGVRLLHRTTRQVTLTDEGALYAERARLAMDELKEAADAAREQRALPTGTLRISVPLSFGHMHLLPALSGFARICPDVTMDVVLEDRMVDVISEGFDLAIRIGPLKDSTLAVRHLGDCPMYLVASPGYLKTHPSPASPAQLKRHRLITYAQQGGAGEWRFRDAKGAAHLFRAQGHFKTNTAEMMAQAALDDLGIALLPAFCASDYLRAEKLVQLLPGYEAVPARQISALMPPTRFRTAKVQLFLQWLSDACKSMPLEYTKR